MKKIILSLITSIFIFSCENMDLKEKNKTVPAKEEIAIANVAENFANCMQQNETRISSEGISAERVRKIDFPQIKTRTQNNDKTIYSVSMSDNKGTVMLVKSNSRIIPLAYFIKETDQSIQGAVSDTVSDLSFLIKSIAEVALLSDPGYADTSDDYIFPGGSLFDCAPKCKVYWDQIAPYNKYCFTKNGEQALAGCVAVAAAQALTVLRPQMNIISSWDEVVKETPSAKAMDEIAKLISYIGKEVKTEYGAKASGAQMKYLSPLFEKYGIKDYGYDNCINVLSNTTHGVCIISGYKEPNKEGHAFLADGLQWYSNGTVMVEGKEPDVLSSAYLHLNYGWGKSYKTDAYILSIHEGWKKEAEDIYGATFRYGMKYYCYAIKEEYEEISNW